MQTSRIYINIYGKVKKKKIFNLLDIGKGLNLHTNNNEGFPGNICIQVGVKFKQSFCI